MENAVLPETQKLLDKALQLAETKSVEACELMKQAKDLQPGNSEVMCECAWIYGKPFGEFANAREHLQIVLKSDAKNAHALLLMGLFGVGNSRYLSHSQKPEQISERRKYFEECIAAEPGGKWAASAHMYLAKLESTFSKDQALIFEHLKAVIDLEPHNLEAYVFILQVMQKQACAQSEILDYCGRALMAPGSDKNVDILYKNVIVPYEYLLLRNLGDLQDYHLEVMRRVTEIAARYLECKGEETDENFSSKKGMSQSQLYVRYVRGVCFFGLKEAPNALKDFDYILARKETYKDTLQRKAEILFVLHRPQEAFQTMERAVHVFGYDQLSNYDQNLYRRYEKFAQDGSFRKKSDE